jgi:hypothetical protein
LRDGFDLKGLEKERNMKTRGRGHSPLLHFQDQRRHISSKSEPAIASCGDNGPHSLPSLLFIAFSNQFLWLADAALPSMAFIFPLLSLGNE